MSHVVKPPSGDWCMCSSHPGTGCGLWMRLTASTGAAGATHRRLGAGAGGRCTEALRRMRSERFSSLARGWDDVVIQSEGVPPHPRAWLPRPDAATGRLCRLCLL
ncbi:MAG: hypothetical protein LCI00_15655 [Chloroflexi bacterium]|nr:hypothetical protein [Chloroflexota bacterium]